MLTCIHRFKQSGSSPDDQHDIISINGNPATNKQPVKTLTSQIKEMAMKASGVYRNCGPCSGPVTHHRQKTFAESASASERSNWSYRRTRSSNSSSTEKVRVWGKEMEARVNEISTPATGRRVEPVVLVEENEPKEWVAQVEPGVLITFVSLPPGGNELKRIRFSREMFNKLQAQRWWAENYDKVMELYNVQKLNRQAFPLPTPLRSEDDQSLKIDQSDQNSPITPPLNEECLPRTLHPTVGTEYSSSDGLTATPKLSRISGTKTEALSVSREADRSEELSISNASDLETEWVEQDEPGVYITIRALAGGARELKRVRFSREKFGEMHARLWWEENRTRIRKKYL